MIPIFEQSSGKGVGHSVDTFISRFDEICQEHLYQRRARAFAFIFYDFNNADLRHILKDLGAFAKLDRLAGNQLSIFYLHEETRASVARFNDHFLALLNIKVQATLPCVVFFKISGDEIKSVKIAQLDSTDLIHGFHDLFTAIERYIVTGAPVRTAETPAIKWVKGTSKFIGLEIFRAGLKRIFE